MANHFRGFAPSFLALRITRDGKDETTRHANLRDLAQAVASLVLQERARWASPPRVGNADAFREVFSDSGRTLRIAMRPGLACWAHLTSRDASARPRRDFAGPYVDIEAFGRAGKRLRLQGLVGSGLADLQRQNCRRRLWARLRDWCGTGPVPGTGRLRHGTFIPHWRPCRTSQERRHAAHAFAEEGEVGPRACRNTVLPEVWDDRARQRIKCWKSQHTGRKSWDR